MRCPACSGPMPENARFCPRCGVSSRIPEGEPDATRTSVDSTYPSVEPVEADGRFATGTMLGGRYRIVGLLGRGGMGEVYRADDLKLGRTVALKFLPEAMERDPSRLARFLNEVRVAVQVSHPNVCRVHDVTELDGRHVISMEYVDGEDLGTLLRRIGRLPGDRAVQAARQLCAGLAAAHSRGVLHRDLKPANVMIDGRGEVKITDFGLAGAIGDFDGAEIRVGTPAYMAPEQLAGSEVTVRSDVYALGLVLYEMFAGNPAYADRTREGIARRTEVLPPSLTTSLDDIDPAVARIVERCLAAEPSDRPSSAIAVAAALPGGDPLAAALAAGETPSPELVAEAGGTGGLKPGMAVAMLVAILAGVGAAGWLSTRLSLVSRVGLDRPPAVLLDRAEEIVRGSGWDPGIDRLFAWNPDWSYVEHVREGEGGLERFDVLAQTRPAGLIFQYRASRFELRRSSEGSVGNWMGDPPMVFPGMVQIDLDPSGRLTSFQAVPERFDARDADGGSAEAAADLSSLFEAADLDPAGLVEAEPSLRPAGFADRRYAWTGSYEAHGETVPVRVEASSIRGRVLSFTVLEPWRLPADTKPTAPKKPTLEESITDVVGALWFVLAIIGATIVAVRNVRLRRGDHRTALRFGLYLAGIRLVWLLGTHISGDPSGVLRSHFAWSAYRLCVSYVFYMALEPYARRLWPEMLVSWVRLFSLRFRDARVGRDLLVGVLTGCAFVWIQQGLYWLDIVLLGSNAGLDNQFWSWESLRGVRSALITPFGLHATSVLDTLTGIMLFLVTRVVTRSTPVAIAVTSVLAWMLFSPGELFDWTYVLSFALTAVLYWVVLFRSGLLGLLLAFTVEELLRGVRVTSDLFAWHALPMWLVYGLVLALALWGFRAALSGRPLFRDEIHGT